MTRDLIGLAGAVLSTDSADLFATDDMQALAAPSQRHGAAAGATSSCPPRPELQRYHRFECEYIGSGQSLVQFVEIAA